MKKLMVICAPASWRSGYGDHARDLIKSFIRKDKYDIKIIDVRWGDCPQNALDKNNSSHKNILYCIACINCDYVSFNSLDDHVLIKILNWFTDWTFHMKLLCAAGWSYPANAKSKRPKNWPNLKSKLFL